MIEVQIAELELELVTARARVAELEAQIHALRQPTACRDCRVRALGCAGCPENPDAVSVEMPAFLEGGEMSEQGTRIADQAMDALVEWQRRTAAAEDEASALRCEIARLKTELDRERKIVEELRSAETCAVLAAALEPGRGPWA